MDTNLIAEINGTNTRDTHEVLHYVEKPESYVSSVINCGIYLLSLEIFDYIRDELSKNQSIEYNK